MEHVPIGLVAALMLVVWLQDVARRRLQALLERSRSEAWQLRLELLQAETAGDEVRRERERLQVAASSSMTMAMECGSRYLLAGNALAASGQLEPAEHQRLQDDLVQVAGQMREHFPARSVELSAHIAGAMRS